MKCKKCKPDAEMELVKQYSTIDDVIWDKNYTWIWKCPYCGSKEQHRFGKNIRYGERPLYYEKMSKR